MRSILAAGRGVAICAASSACALAQGMSPSIEDLRGLSLEELAQVNVSVVQRRAQPLEEAPGAVFAITSEDIRRSGVTSLPEALRLAPNLNVARDKANAWAISARGFNSVETANKLLVLIDTRSVYSNLHAGVFWDEEHVLLQDIDRIEVLSGPGGALWGANAVNGVINVISKNSADTQGVAASVTGGSLDSTASVRLGGRLGPNMTYRVYGSAFGFDNTRLLTGAAASDDYDGVYSGARADWDLGDTDITLQAQAFDDNLNNDTGDVWGGYVRGRVSHGFADASRLFVQGYVDTSTRKDANLNDRVTVYDLTFQYTFAPLGDHRVIAGGGYRHTDDSYRITGPFTLQPPEDNQELVNAFIQDTFSLTPNLELTAGVKVEDSSFSGFEYMPSIRVGWTPGRDVLLWAAVSRAVRTPVRIDRDLVGPPIFIGGPIFKSEELIAYEIGYRGRPAGPLTLNVTAYLHDYDDLRTTTPVSGAGVFPLQFTNDLSGVSYGVEAWADFRAAPWWLLRASVTTLGKDFELDPATPLGLDFAGPPSTGADPSFQTMLRSRMNLTEDIEFDAGLRWVDGLDTAPVPEYVEMDARLAWQATPSLELSIVGANLLHEDHLETTAEGPPNRIRRGVFVGANWGF